MTPLFWAVIWSAFPPLALSCGPDCCIVHESSSSQHVSPLLKSLQCHNDYESHVHCKWREHGNETLWFKNENNIRQQCVPYGDEDQDTSEHRTVQCRYETPAFSIGIKHTLFFLKNQKAPTLCTSGPHDLSQHLRARPPANLSTHGAADGGRWVSWSSPYPSSSSLNKHISYQLSYRTDRQDTWTSADVTNTSVKLEKRLLLPGRRYEARARARASVGQWSLWSPVVTWHTEAGTGQFPSLHCVLHGEQEVTCSWEVSREVDHFITYQLACRRQKTAASKRCCVNPTVSSDPIRPVLTYSCSLPVADPAHLLLELLPARNAKSFNAYQHIRPNKPQQVTVRQRDNSWKVEWSAPSTASNLRLYYQVYYYSTHDQGSSVLLNVSEGSMSLNILGASLAPVQRYQVKVRSLVVPGFYQGIPSEWTEPVDWTSHEATWSPLTLIYLTISVFVAAVFLTLFCTIPACQRRAVLWVDSVPSPGKSKILCEIKVKVDKSTSASIQNESVTVCKVLHLDSVSTCSSDTLLWPTKGTGKKRLEQDESCWEGDNLPAEEVNSSDTSSMSFSGPYIFCQSSESSHKSVDAKCEENEQETPSDDSALASPMMFTLYGDNYVCLPGRSVSKSAQDLVSHCAANTNRAEQDQHSPDKMDEQPGLSEPTSSPQPPAQTSGLFTPCPQEGSTQASGYCHLPAAFMRAAK